jgi:hypothetical protein
VELVRRSYDGRRFGRATVVDPGPMRWDRVRGAFWVGGQLFYALRDGNLYRRSDDCGSLGPQVRLDPYRDPAWAGVPTGSGHTTYTGRPPRLYRQFPDVSGFAYRGGRLFFTLRGEPRLFWSWFEPDSGIVGDTVFTAGRGALWRDAHLGFFVGDRLLFAAGGTGRIHEVRFRAGHPVGEARPAGRGRTWAGRALFLVPSRC